MFIPQLTIVLLMFILQIWKQDRASKGVGYAYVENKADFDQVKPDTTDYLLG